MIPCQVQGSLLVFQSERALLGSVWIIFLNCKRDEASVLIEGFLYRASLEQENKASEMRVSMRSNILFNSIVALQNEMRFRIFS